MAAQVDGPASELTAEMVGHAFVSQFYHYLHNSPEMVQRFFRGTSKMIRPGPDGALLTVNSLEGINDLILSLDCKDFKAEILTADAQASHVDGVIVLVTGCLTGKDDVRRKFTESFFLAPQDNGYYVLNNIFRFVDDSPMLNSFEEKNLNEGAPSTTSAVIHEVGDIPIDSAKSQAGEVQVNDKEVVDAPKDEKKPAVKVSTPPQPHVEPSQNGQPAVKASSNGHADAPKKSYASLLKNMKEGTNATVVRLTPFSKTATSITPKQPVSDVNQSCSAHADRATVSDLSVSNITNGAVNSADDQVDDKGHSIYIGDLPWNATIELLENEFKQFGRIKHNGIQVRSNKGYCFGFVEYEDASAKEKAMEMGTLLIGGKEAFIQEKKTTTRVVNGVSMYPSGRGGFRNDGFRGRGGYSNGRGYARNDYGKRNGEATPFQGNRGGDGFQNGGGRGGPSQTGAPK